jgi:hypothetical protein
MPETEINERLVASGPATPEDIEKKKSRVEKSTRLDGASPERKAIL